MSLDVLAAAGADSYPGIKVNRIALDMVKTYPYAARNAMVELSLLVLSFSEYFYCTVVVYHAHRTSGVLTILTVTSIRFVL